VLPLHVQGLGLSTFVVGLVTGSQFAASLISRVWSGHYADRRGAKRAVVVGLLTAVAAGLLYLLSLRFVGTPWLSVTPSARSHGLHSKNTPDPCGGLRRRLCKRERARGRSVLAGPARTVMRMLLEAARAKTQNPAP
jgi:hypothetical protein